MDTIDPAERSVGEPSTASRGVAADGPPRDDGFGIWPVALTAVATVASAVACLWRIGDKSLFRDETFTTGVVDQSTWDLVVHLFKWEQNQAPYYLIFQHWREFGSSDGYLRSLSAVFVVASVPALYVVGRRLFDARVGALAAATLALNSFVVEYGQTLRGYSMAMFACVLATLLLLRALDVPSTGRIVAYAVVGVVAAYVHFFALLVLAAHGLALAFVRPLPVRLVKLAAPIGLVLTLPLIEYTLGREGDPLDWIDKPGGNEAFSVVRRFVGAADSLHVVVWVALAGLGALSLVHTWWRDRGVVDARPAPWAIVLVLGWLAVPVLVSVGSTYTVKPLLVERYLIVAMPAFALLVALGIMALPWRTGRVLAALAVVVVSLLGLDHWYSSSPRQDWRAAIAAVEARVQSGDRVVGIPGEYVYALEHYFPIDDRPDVLIDFPDDEVREETAPGDLYELVRTDVTPTDRPELVPDHFLEDPDAYEAWRDDNFVLVEEETTNDVLIRRYEQRR